MLGASAATRRPFAPTKQELQLAIVGWMKQNKPELLKCKVEAYLKSRGHEVIWTPPYCATLQPIELFWAAGKNYAADHCFNGRTMKQTVQLLREGWYGNEKLWLEGENYLGHGRMKRRQRRPVNCAGLVRTTEDFMNNKFIPIAGFGGTIDDLQGTEGFNPTTVDMPIDMVINREDEDDGDAESD